MCKFIKVNCNKEFAHLHICTFVYLALTLTEFFCLFFSVNYQMHQRLLGKL